MATRSSWLILILLLVAWWGTGCGSDPAPAPTDTRKELRIGVTPDFPPLVFKKGDELVGAEIDMANRLARHMNRKPVFVELLWEEQIPALLEKRTDIIMSSMTITEARRVRIAFSSSYLTTGAKALMRLEDYQLYDSIEEIEKTSANVGVMRGTTAERYVEKTLTSARAVRLTHLESAVFEAQRRAIDLFIHDGPAIQWLASVHEGRAGYFHTPLTTEHLGWGLRREDAGLMAVVNDILSVWKEDGALDQMLERWLPPPPLEEE